MINKTVYLVDIMKVIVADVATKLGKSVYYKYGGFKEVFNELEQLANNDTYTNYPLVWLITDFEQKKGIGINIYSEATVNMLIFNKTLPEWSSEQRTLYSFKAQLHPIYEQLISSIEASHSINSGFGESEHKQTDHYSWGRDKIEMTKDGKPFSDYIDAVEINNLTLKIYKQNC
ncbi:MAG TPA: hypothetical protein VIK86_05595 [Candidatus Paceibacterota bacterium]